MKLMDKKEILVPNSALGSRLDLFLESKLNETRSQIKKMISNEKILLNDKKVKAGYILQGNETISIEILKAYALEPKNLHLKAIYEDEYIAVIDKPSNLVVHPGSGREEETLVHGLLYQFSALAKGSSPERPGIVHRLDKDTSGLILIAKTDESYFEFVKLFKEHRIEKKYMAIVHGKVESNGLIDKPIGRSHRNRTMMAVDVSPAKEAISSYKVLNNFGDYSLLEVNIKTGRTHQIRVHLSSIGFSVVGDTVYGHQKPKARRQLLHSSNLSFIHPFTRNRIELFSDLPQDFLSFLKGNGGEYASNFR